MLQLVTFAGSLSVIIDHSDKFNGTVKSLAVIFTALNGVTLILAFFNLNSAIYIYTAFLKKGREVFEEQRRLEFESRKSKKKRNGNGYCATGEFIRCFLHPILI